MATQTDTNSLFADIDAGFDETYAKLDSLRREIRIWFVVFNLMVVASVLAQTVVLLLLLG